MIIDKNNVCAYYDLYIIFGTGFLLTRVHLEFVSAKKIDVIVEDNLDCYEYIDNDFQFCKSCYCMIIKKKILKFGSANCINVSSNQKYSPIPSDLTPIEKVFIAYAYPIMLIIKFRLSGFGFSVLYY